MQTFLPYPDFQQSAKCLDNRRLGKQRVECLQILNTLAKGKYICSKCRQPIIDNGMCCRNSRAIITPWYNHPAVKMWKGYEWRLFDYGATVCNTWINRGFKDNIKNKLYIIINNFQYQSICFEPPWLGNSDFHLSHQSNLIRKFPEHYRPIFGPDVPDNLPYVWPVK